MTDPFESIAELARRLRRGEATSVATTGAMLARIEAHDDALNSYVTVDAEGALEAARAADAALARGEDRGPLHGVPLGIKDLFDTAGLRTTCGSLLYADHVPEADATVVRKLRAAGAVILGKTGMHELADGTTSNNPHFGAIRNPWDVTRDPGGSSGGSAVAVAAGLAFGALGSDTACSIRQPAHCCGIVGLKPTFGLVSKAGAQPLAWTLDHAGPMTRTVEDAALMLSAIAGPDPDDPWSHLGAVDVSMRLRPIEGARIGVMRRYFFDGDRDVAAVVETALERLAAAGARLVEVDIPDIEEAYRAGMATFAETAQIFGAALAETPELFSEEQRREIGWAGRFTATDYIDAQQFRRGFTRRMEALLGELDGFAAPTATLPAQPIGNIATAGDGSTLRNCLPFDVTGQPAISIPCGLTEAGLPVGLMLAAPRFADGRLLGLAAAAEAALGGFAPPPGAWSA